jgi:hypothetical protein
MTLDERARALIYVTRYVGTDVTAAFLQKTAEHCPPAGIPHLHSLQEGIYKPAGAEHALCIWSRSAMGGASAIYPDVLRIEPNGTWTMDYASKEGGPTVAVNRGLQACLRDRLPLLVITTSRPKDSPGGARYRLLGLALIEAFDAANGLFHLRGCTSAVMDGLRGRGLDDQLEQVYLRDRLVLPFQLAEPRTYVESHRAERDRAFRAIVLEEYKRQCCVCGALFLLREAGRELVVEAEAAHIIPVPERGPDDPRNGLSLCRRHHWSFDRGLFTVTDGLLVRVSAAVGRAERRRFDLEEYDGDAIQHPSRESCVPDPLALEWHQSHIFRAA